MKSIRILLILCILAFLAACAPKGPVLLTDSDTVYKEVYEKNHQECAYKGAVLVKYRDQKDAIRFRALLDKRCDDAFIIKVLGGFGAVLYDVTYKMGHVVAFSKGEDVSAKAQKFTDQNGLAKLFSDIKFPYLIPDRSYDLSYSKDRYVFSSGDSIVEADDSFKIRKVKFADKTYEYDYDLTRIRIIRFYDEERELELKLK